MGHCHWGEVQNRLLLRVHLVNDHNQNGLEWESDGHIIQCIWFVTGIRIGMGFEYYERLWIEFWGIGAFQLLHGIRMGMRLELGGLGHSHSSIESEWE